MLSFLTVCKCYHFCVIIFPCTAWVLSFMLSFNVIIFCYHFPPFFFFLKTWHTLNFVYKPVSLASVVCYLGYHFVCQGKPLLHAIFVLRIRIRDGYKVRTRILDGKIRIRDFLYICFGGLYCVGYSFAYVAHFRFLRNVRIQTHPSS
jgi:hypothetical protein